MAVTAREKFARGDRVRMSERAIALELGGKGKRRPPKIDGCVVGFGRKPQLVRVLRDGLKTSESYHIDFWEVVPEAEER